MKYIIFKQFDSVLRNPKTRKATGIDGSQAELRKGGTQIHNELFNDIYNTGNFTLNFMQNYFHSEKTNNNKMRSISHNQLINNTHIKNINKYYNETNGEKY